MNIAPGTRSDVRHIVRMHLSDEQYARKVERAYYFDKVKAYVEHPCAAALVAWDEDHALGFVLVNHHDNEFRKYCRSPKVLLRVAARILTGQYGWDVNAVAAHMRLATQRLHNYGMVVETAGIAIPDAWIGSIHTDEWARRSHPGIAMSLLRHGEDFLIQAGVSYWGLWVNVDHELMIRMYKAMGYHIRCTVPRINEDCYLITNTL